MFRSIRAIALSIVVLTLAACGSDTSQLATSQPTTTQSAVTEPAVTEPAVTEPAVTEPASTEPASTEPQRIISLAPTATEMLFAIGAGDQVIAVDDQSNYPAEALAKKTDLSGYTPNVEAIAAYEPDLVVISDDSQQLTGQLAKLGIDTWVGPAATTFVDVYTQIEQLGAATGHVTEAKVLVAQMNADIDAAVAAVPKLDTPPTYYHELDNTFFSVTSNTFIGQVYGLFGLRNIADSAEASSDYPQLSPEFIISQSPDLIFLADSKCCGETPETVTARPGWSVIHAVSTKNIVVVDDDIASRWGPRLVDYVKLVADAIGKVAALSAG